MIDWGKVWLAFLAVGTAEPTRILFGSCNKVELHNPLWPHIVARKPAVWIWGGDNVYADKLQRVEWRPRWENPRPRAVFHPTTEAALRGLYAAQLAQPGYAALRQMEQQNQTVILGTWDDHDFGINDGDRTFAGKAWSQVCAPLLVSSIAPRVARSPAQPVLLIAHLTVKLTWHCL